MNRRAIYTGITLAAGAGLALALLWLLGGGFPVAEAQGPDGYSTYHVAPSCTGVPDPCYTAVQAAVDAADDPGDVIKVAAGTYSGVSARAGVTQVVYISKTVTVRGGYTTDNWDTPDPEANPTTLDAVGQGRVFYIAGAPSAGPGQAVSPTIEGLRITGGDAAGTRGGVGEAGAGGGIFGVTATVTLSNCWVFSNTAGGEEGGYGRGGGVYLQGANATLNGNTILSNTARGGYYYDATGGGVYLQGANAVLSDNIIQANTASAENAPGKGGGVYLQGTNATLDGNTIRDNVASGWYKEPLGSGAPSGVSNATLSGNAALSDTASLRARPSDDEWSDGGGVYFEGTAATISDNTILGNVAGSGGGLYFNGCNHTRLSSNTVSTNTGGGLGFSYCNDTRLNGNTISANTGAGLGFSYCNDTRLGSNTVSTNTGGGLSFWGCYDTRLSGDTISANTGRGLHFRECNDTSLSGNTISANIGGGLSLDQSDATVINNIIADNRADSVGNGLYVERSSVRLLHTTIARNTGGDGSGIYVAGSQWDPPSTVVLSNTILVSHTVGITVAAENTATLDATLWGDGVWGNDTDWDGDGVILTGTHNYRGDPAFVSPNSGDYRIGSTSAARDAGIDAGVKRDIEGQPRPMDREYDIGADEYPGVGLDVVKRPSALTVQRGQVLTYTIVVTSAGTEDATSVVLTDTLDGWQRPIAATASVGTCSVANGDWGGSVVCTPGTMLAGAKAVVTLTAQVSTAVPLGQAMVNTVAVLADETANRTQATTYAQDCYARINDAPAEYTTVQAAVDAANPGSLVKVAGFCVGASERGGLRQQVYLSKTVTIRGGYATHDWATPDAEANPTTLDALGQGRVLYITGDPSAGSGQTISPTIEGLRITGGDAAELGGWWDDDWEDAGGGVYVDNSSGTIRDNQVFSNTAGLGGGLYLQESDATLIGNSVSGNTATGTAGRSGGGGLYLSGGNATLVSNTVGGNTTTGTSHSCGGGGLYLGESDATLISNTVRGNTAAGTGYSSGGGGLYLRGGDATLVSNTVSGNTVTGAGDRSGGGGLYLSGGDATVVGNTVSGNTATGTGYSSGGGGLYLRQSGATLGGNIICSNTADGSGGGLHLRWGSATLTNNIVADNQADTAGSGMYVSGSSPHLLHITIARNGGGDGSGVYVTEEFATQSNVILTNTILVSHTVGISVTAGNTATLEATLWGSDAWANDADWGGAGAIVTGTVNVWGDPAFLNPDRGDYHIGANSAAVDAGVDAGVTMDIDGEPRPIGTGYDIGADEYSAVLYLPMVYRGF